MSKMQEYNQKMLELMGRGFNPYPAEEWIDLFRCTMKEYQKDFKDEESIMFSSIIARSVSSITDKQEIRMMIQLFLNENLDDSVSFIQRQRLASLAHALLLRQDSAYLKEMWVKIKDLIDDKKKYPVSFGECLSDLKYFWAK